ncbi:retrovirus-related pol polyprotein from transposon TNT 1-94 [Tanacetum coccineum]
MNNKNTRFHQALKNSGWVQAMNTELEALEKNNTWSLSNLPPGHKPITYKWVYKTKFNPDGGVERLKARLVVRGFNRQEGVDYKHTFSPVSKLARVRVLIAIATAKQWPLQQLDIINGTFTAALVYVDDVLIAGDSMAEIQSIKAGLDQKSTIKDLGLAKYFLGIEFVSAPKDARLQAALYLLNYLKGSASKGIFYPVHPHLKITGFTDADWAACLMTRKSLTGYYIFLGHSLVSWKTKKQAIVSRSSIEA